MAQDVDKAVTGAATAKEPAKQNSGQVAAAKAPSQEASQEVDEGTEVHFSPLARVQTYVLEDGTRVSDGDVVDSDVFSQLQNVELEGGKLLDEEEGE